MEIDRNVRRTPGPHENGASSVGALGYLTTGVAATARIDDDDEQIRRTCARRGLTLVEMIRESDSGQGGRVRRPALEYALQRISDGAASCLVVARFETLSYSVADLGTVLAELHRRDGHLLSIDPEIDTRSEAGRTVVRALVAISQRERERLAERTRNGLKTARRLRPKRRPAVEDRPELKQRILDMRERGMTLQAIADALNEDGVPTLRGGARWRPSSVHASAGYKRRDNGASR
jgi:DNA invertase Pin-like site-specific DNA recombinase